MAFRAPFMLLHLGGPDTITAYAVQDNELWLRHLVGLVVQSGVALYIFLLSWKVTTPHPAIPLPSTLLSPLPSPLPSPCDALSLNLSGYYLFPALNTVLQTNIVQRESILNLMKQVAGGGTTANGAVNRGGMPAQIAAMEKSLLEASHDREKELLHEITELQWRFICAEDELQKIKTENAQVKM
ncbi:hypothetical protein ACB092_05G270000 [Castanea dentata]